jgi:tetratricopeptide (TPR) repeat protein
MSNLRFLNRKTLAVFCLFLALPLANLSAADAAAPVLSSITPPENLGSNDALRAYLQLQEQLHDTQLSIERSRQEAQAAAAQDATALSNRLQAIEQSLLAQRANESETTQRTNHLLMTIVGIFAVVGFAAALITAYFQWRAVSRLADISAALSAGRGFAFPTTAALTVGEHEALGNGSVEQANTRLIGLVQQLEKRIAELEHTAALPLQEAAPATNGNGNGNGGELPEPHPELALDSAADGKAGQIAKLLERGQTLLNERPEEALAAFDEILLTDPNHAEALVKKGTALEKMRQPQEALECYDRAIAADGSLTIAYLHKGGLCSRLEKYGEAMECYERALHTQEKKRAA